MNPELEKLIDFALADGVITDKEREIIRKKAEKLGEDPDEAEMILDAKLAMQNKDAAPPIPPPVGAAPPTPPPVAAAPVAPPPSMPPPTAKQKSSKVGNIMTCPACGATVNAMELNCSECGHEFRNVQGSSSLKRLKEELKKADDECMNFDKNNSKMSRWFTKLTQEVEIRRCNSLKKQADIIRAHSFETSKEEILEYLSYSISQIKSLNSEIQTIEKRISSGDEELYDQEDLAADNTIRSAWISIVEQCKAKAKFGITDEAELNELLQLANEILN